MIIEKALPLPQPDSDAPTILKGVADPPPYTPGPAGAYGHRETARASSSVAAPLPPSTNRLRIHRDGSVKETVVIDTSLPVLPGNNCDKALDIFSKHGSAVMRVHLVGQDVKGKAAIEVRSDHGAANLTICDRPPTMRISIFVKSDHHHATVYLPRDFQGPLTTVYKHGSASILPSMAACTRIIEETNGERKYWVGDWNGETAWDGDECFVQSRHADVTVGFYDRAEEEEMLAKARAKAEAKAAAAAAKSTNSVWKLFRK